MKLPYRKVVEMIQPHYYKLFCEKYNLPRVNVMTDESFINCRDAWITENCHCWLSRDGGEWIFWSKGDYLMFIIKWT